MEKQLPREGSPVVSHFESGPVLGLYGGDFFFSTSVRLKRNR
jgi:hypothetical protein